MIKSASNRGNQSTKEKPATRAKRDNDELKGNVTDETKSNLGSIS
jgi:hypothetical protein